MTKTDDRIARQARRLAMGSGLVLAGLSLGGMLAVLAPDAAEAGPKRGATNFVRSVNHDAISGVALDEEVVIRFSAAVAGSTVGPDTILIRSGPTNGEQARGQYIVGKFMFDRSTQRRVVIRPEAVQEFYQLVRSLPRADATRKARNLIQRVERTGSKRLLKKIDRGLRGAFSSTVGVGVRLDDDGDGLSGNGTSGFFPAPVGDTTTQPTRAQYRRLVAGDDALWAVHLDTSDAPASLAAYNDLTSQSEWERFWHTTDSASGVRSPRSVLREREYRRVMVSRKGASRVMFVPDIPIRADLADTGFKSSRAYSIIIPTGQPGVFNTVLSKQGRRPLVQADGRDFATNFTTVPTGSGTLFKDNESRKGVGVNQKPRVICMTPPEGEFNVDPTTDWEDPDNLVLSDEDARRTFTIRLRFNHPLDPRTVSPSTFQLLKIGTKPAEDPPEAPVNPIDPPIPIALGTFLNQHRLGIVEVEVTPAINLDAEGVYRLIVQPQVAGLSRSAGTLLGQPFTADFTVGRGKPPVERFKIDFSTTEPQTVAPLNSPDHPGQVTTCFWPAPARFDPQGTGRAVAAFLTVVGFGEGAPLDPSIDPGIDPEREIELIRTVGQTVTFLTERMDPSDLATFGKQLEYSYENIQVEFTSISARGLHPLVLRSRSSITMDGSFVFLNGQPGAAGRTNTNVVSGPPTGGLGGAPGAGGQRGGDGANAPQTGPLHLPVTDGNGNFIFDPNKFDGEDGVPGRTPDPSDASKGYAGAGGFSANQQGNTLFSGGTYQPTASPDRVREGGGGGGHGTAGGNADGAGITGKTHPAGHFGGVGGQAFGSSIFSDQTINSLGLPVLGRLSCGRGGGGGGAEKEPDGGGSLETNGPEDPGGGGGGGGGGGVHMVARTLVSLRSTEVHVEGGAGGQTLGIEGEANPGAGRGAPGGGGSGGSIWIQSFGVVEIINGSKLFAQGGDNTTAIGQNIPAPLANPNNPPPASSLEDTVTGRGGLGGSGYIRVESRSGSANIGPLAVIQGVFSQGTFAPGSHDINGNFLPGVLEGLEGAPELGDFGSHQGVPFVVGNSVGYSRWLDSGLSTASFLPTFDNPATPEIDGTFLQNGGGGTVAVRVRGAFNDVGNSGRPNLNNPTPWVALEDLNASVRDRQFVQFRVEFRVPEGFTFGDTLPYADCVQIEIDLR